MVEVNCWVAAARSTDGVKLGGLTRDARVPKLSGPGSSVGTLDSVRRLPSLDKAEWLIVNIFSFKS